MSTFFVEKIWNVWTSGGWTLIPLFLLALFIYGSAIRLLMYFRQREFLRCPEETWIQWVRNPKAGEGELGEIIRYTQEDVRSVGDIHNRFLEVMLSKFPFIDRQINFVNLLTTAAPLIGLLGTVTGMLLTFQTIGMGGGELTDRMAAGISAALFPPEVGLCVALPGLAFVYLLKRKRQEYDAFLTHLESQTVQHWKKNHEQESVIRKSEQRIKESNQISSTPWAPALMKQAGVTR